MSKIQIKQINNSPATTGGLILFDGSSNVWSNADDGAIQLSSGTTAQRPTGVNGMLRYNQSLNCIEGFINGSWSCVTYAGSGLGQGGILNFFHAAGTENVWLSVDSHHQLPSGPNTDATTAPAIMPFDGIVYALTFINKSISTETDFEFYRNGTLIFTWQIRDRKWAYKTNSLSSLTFSAGDRIGVFARKVDPGEKPDTVNLHMYYTFTSGTTGENGSSTL